MSSSPEVGQSRLTLLLIAGTPLIIILAASWLWYFVVQGNIDLVGAIGTANNGTLITPPRQIQSQAFQDDVGASFGWQDLEPRWTLVLVNSGSHCDSACERRLYFARQIHIALGKEFNRVQRVYIGDTPIDAVTVEASREITSGAPVAYDGNDLAGYLASTQQGLVPLTLSAEELRATFPELLDHRDQWFLVDPAGWIMMRFDDQLDYKAVLADLKFLLKHSGGA